MKKNKADLYFVYGYVFAIPHPNTYRAASSHVEEERLYHTLTYHTYIIIACQPPGTAFRLVHFLNRGA